MKNTELRLNVSVGKMKLGDDVNKYLSTKHLYFKKDEADEFMEDYYKFYDPPIIVFVDNQNKITTINCKVECHWKGINLIGLPFNDFLQIAAKEPDSQEEIYILIDESHGQTQTVYGFESTGLQVWVWKEKIVTVSCTNYSL